MLLGWLGWCGYVDPLIGSKGVNDDGTSRDDGLMRWAGTGTNATQRNATQRGATRRDETRRYELGLGYSNGLATTPPHKRNCTHCIYIYILCIGKAFQGWH
jgi:hypothetical protein